jgi:hypothetical protein
MKCKRTKLLLTAVRLQLSELRSKRRNMCVFCCTMWVLLYLLYYVCTAGATLDAELLARSQYLEGPPTGHLDTGFSWFPWVYKQMLRWFPNFQVPLHASHVALPI